MKSVDVTHVQKVTSIYKRSAFLLITEQFEIHGFVIDVPNSLRNLFFKIDIPLDFTRIYFSSDCLKGWRRALSEDPKQCDEEYA